MKLIYSQLQKLLPKLDVAPQKLRDDLTMIGHFVNYFETIDGELVFDFDTKAHRGECFGYYGIARDLSVLYNIPLELVKINPLSSIDYQLPISITSPDVYRVMCQKITGIKVGPSPEWLSKFVQIHGVNSVNNVVDLTNYIMFLYGIPNHAFDVAKTGENLIWENNHGKTTDFTTLDGTILKLSHDNLVISNPQEVVSTDFVGGKHSGTYDSTTEIIVEVAIYNPTRIRLDTREHKTFTEAGSRLEKVLDPELIPQAISHLVSLIIEICGGCASSQIFDYYPHKVPSPQIKFNPDRPSEIAGINIPAQTALDILTRLGCDLTDNLVTPPTIRKDLEMEEDLCEEVIRFYGYQNIPTNEPLALKGVTDVTPPVLYLIEELKDKLVALGYDEILSWPLVKNPTDQTHAIAAQNSINAEYPYLRQSITQSLKDQVDQYSRLKLPQSRLFEIGKIFSRENGQYFEKYSLGLYHHNPHKLTEDLKSLGLNADFSEDNYLEVYLDKVTSPAKYVPKDIDNSAIELTSQIITLDANVISEDSPEKVLTHYRSLIPSDILWSLEITDHYQNKYTFRASYYNCDDKTAKKIHLESFGLIK